MPWNYENLWEKAKKYFDKGLKEGPNSEYFELWLSLGLELLARATLAKIHPSLLAGQEDDKNFLHAWGFHKKKGKPWSIPITTVFNRCEIIITKFTEAELKFCKILTEKRNAELHSGESPFGGNLKPHFLPEFYMVCKILTESQEKTLSDLLGKKEAKIADNLIEAANQKHTRQVKDLIKKHKKEFDALKLEEKLKKQKESKEIAQQLSGSMKEEVCPSCGASAVIKGKIVKHLEPRVGDDKIIKPTIYLPTKFKCKCCGFALNGFSEIHAAESGDQYIIEKEIDPIEYYYQPEDFYEPEPDYDWSSYR